MTAAAKPRVTKWRVVESHRLFSWMEGEWYARRSGLRLDVAAFRDGRVVAHVYDREPRTDAEIIRAKATWLPEADPSTKSFDSTRSA